MILAILASLILWPLYVAVSLVLDVIGLVLIAILALFPVRTRWSKVWRGPVNTAHGPARVVTVWPGGWLTWLWGNEEDGVTGATWFRNARVSWSTWRQAYTWSALRNPSNNLRFIPWINPVIAPARIRSYVWGTSWFVWQGPYAGLWHWLTIRGQKFRFIIGWKLKPEDAKGVDQADMRAPRCGFGLQFKRVA